MLLDKETSHKYLGYINTVNSTMKKLAINSTDGIVYITNGKRFFRTVNDDNIISYKTILEFKPSGIRLRMLERIEKEYTNDTYYLVDSTRLFTVFKERNINVIESIEFKDDGLYFNRQLDTVVFPSYDISNIVEKVDVNTDTLLSDANIVDMDILEKISGMNSSSTVRLVLDNDTHEVKIKNDFLSLDYNVYSIPVMRNTILNIYIKYLKSGTRVPTIEFKVHPLNNVEGVYALNVYNSDKDMDIQQTFIITK